jgi:adenylylsulfate kinase
MDEIQTDLNVVWHITQVTAKDRKNVIKQKPMVLWFTGLSGSGKSTIASIIEKRLIESKYIAYLLDGDNLRHGINANVGFSTEDRNENIRRIAEVSRLFADSGMIVLASAISPFKSLRKFARKRIEEVGEFVEIHVKADVDTCAARDPKGLYKKAITGEIPEFTGISSPYEVPENPELILDTNKYSADECADIVLDYIQKAQIDFERILQVSIDAAVKAGQAIMEIYKKDFEIEYKADQSPLTEADKASNEIIFNALTEDFPSYSVLTEEMADNKSRLDNNLCFIVDPLDGTKEFIKKNGEFTVNIALSYKGKSITGVIYVPAQNKLYYAALDRCAYCCDVDESNANVALYDPAHCIHVSERTENLIVMESRSHGDTRLAELIEAHKEKIANTINSGSSLKGCLIAEGKADI